MASRSNMFNVPIYLSECVYKRSTGRSEVIPNQALHIREILERSARGQFLTQVQMNALQYGQDEPEDGNDFFEPDDDRLDIQDKLSYLELRLKEAKEAQKRHKEAKSQNEDKTEQSVVEDENPGDLA